MMCSRKLRTSGQCSNPNPTRHTSPFQTLAAKRFLSILTMATKRTIGDLQRSSELVLPTHVGSVSLLPTSGVEGEQRVGMTEYVKYAVKTPQNYQHSPSLPGFSATFKQYSWDFLVREIDVEGNPVKLTTFQPPPAEKEEESPITGTLASSADWNAVMEPVIGKELVKHIEQFIKDTSMKELVLPPILEKSLRGKIHRAIRNHPTSLDSGTNAEKNIVVVRRDAKSTQWHDKGRRRGKTWPDGRPSFLRFVLLKDNKDTTAALNTLCKMMRIKPGSLVYAGTKDKRGVTTQHITAKQLKAEKVLGLNPKLHGIKVGNVEYVNEPLKLGRLSGNRFEVALRCVKADIKTIRESCEALERGGFVNYFGAQRFGGAGIPTHAVGIRLLQKDWSGVVQLLLGPHAGMKEDASEAARKAWAEGDAEGTIRLLPSWMSVERKIAMRMQSAGMNKYSEALDTIPHYMRLMYIHGYQSYVWNRAVSERLRAYGSKVVAGDLVYAEEGSKHEEQAAMGTRMGKATLPPVHCVKEEEVDKYTVFDVVMPMSGGLVIYPKHSINYQWYVNTLREDGVEMEALWPTGSRFALPGGYRKMIGRVQDLEWDVAQYNEWNQHLLKTDFDFADAPEFEGIPDGKYMALRLRFTLDKGLYATMCLREILRTSLNSQDQKLLADQLLKQHEAEQHQPKKRKTEEKKKEEGGCVMQ